MSPRGTWRPLALVCRTLGVARSRRTPTRPVSRPSVACWSARPSPARAIARSERASGARRALWLRANARCASCACTVCLRRRAGSGSTPAARTGARSSRTPRTSSGAPMRRASGRPRRAGLGVRGHRSPHLRAVGRGERNGAPAPRQDLEVLARRVGDAGARRSDGTGRLGRRVVAPAAGGRRDPRCAARRPCIRGRRRGLRRRRPSGDRASASHPRHRRRTSVARHVGLGGERHHVRDRGGDRDCDRAHERVHGAGRASPPYPRCDAGAPTSCAARRSRSAARPGLRRTA